VVTNASNVASVVDPQVAVTVTCPALATVGLIDAENAPTSFAVVAPTVVPFIESVTGDPAAHPSPLAVVASPGITVLLLRVRVPSWPCGIGVITTGVGEAGGINTTVPGPLKVGESDLGVSGSGDVGSLGIGVKGVGVKGVGGVGVGGVGVGGVGVGGGGGVGSRSVGGGGGGGGGGGWPNVTAETVSEPHVLTDASLRASPEYDACQ